MNLENLKTDLSVILAEVAILVVLLGILYWLLSRGVGLVFSLPALRNTRVEPPRSARACAGFSPSAALC